MENKFHQLNLVSLYQYEKILVSLSKHVVTFSIKWVCSILDKLNVMRENWYNFWIPNPEIQREQFYFVY